MAFNVSAVTGYVQANEKTLIAKSILKAKTASLVGFQPNVKGSAQINLLTGDATLQKGGCGWTSAGTTTLSKRNIVTGMLKVNEDLCEKDLVGTFAEWGVAQGVGKTSLPFEQYITDAKVKSVQKQVEIGLWQADMDNTGYTGTYLKEFDGLIKIIGAEVSVVDATLTGSTLAAAPITAINAIVAKIPNEVIDADDLTIFTGYDILRAYVAAYNASNQFAGTLMLDGATMSVTVPNTNIKLEGVAGLTGKNLAYATPASNIRVGGDMEGDESKFKFWYSEDNSTYRLKIEFNVGVQVAFPDYIVKYTN